MTLKRLLTTLSLTAFLLGFAAASYAATVKMRVVLVNPSPTKTQTKEIKNYLPKEITLKDVLDSGGLDVEYDEAQGLLYVYKVVELAPAETKTFELVLQDVWMIADEKLNDLRKRTEGIVEKLADTSYYNQAEIISKTIYGRLDEIARSQNDQGVTRQQHIAYFRDNQATLQAVLEDIERLEKILVTVGGPPNIDMLEQTDVEMKSPTTKTTWIVIFIILVFISILGGAFYFTWQGQARVTENIFTRERDATFSDFQKGAEGEAKKPGA